MLRTLTTRRRLYAILAIAALLFARGAVAAHACAAISQAVGGDLLMYAAAALESPATAHHGCEQTEDAIDSSAVCHASCLHDVQAADPAKLPVAAADAPVLLIVAPIAVAGPVSRFVRERFLLAGRAEPPPLTRHCSLLL
jgi:hypothetical protein